MNNKRNVPIYEMTATVSNALAQSKINATEVEDVSMSLGIARIQINSTNDPEYPYPLVADVYATDLLELGISDTNHVYTILKALTVTIQDRKVITEDTKSGDLDVYTVIPKTKYIEGKGIMRLFFAPDIRKDIIGLEDNFTTYSIYKLAILKSPGAKALYKYLQSLTFKIPKGKNRCFDYQMRISELKFTMGFASIDNEEVQKVIRKNKKTPEKIDWDELYDNLPNEEKKYVRPQNFKNIVLDPCQQEFKEKCDFAFDYEFKKEGRSYKYIIFHIYKNKPNDEYANIGKILSKHPLDKDKTLATLNKFYEELEGHNELTEKDIETFLDEAHYDLDLVRFAIKMADDYGYEKIGNYVGWIRSAIRGKGWGSYTDKSDKKHKGKITEKQAASALEFVKKGDNYERFLKELETEGIYLSKLYDMYTAVEILEMFGKFLRHEPLFED